MRILKLVQSLASMNSILVAFTLVGCGSGAPHVADAATEEAIRADMAKVADAEQENNRKNPIPSAPANAEPVFHPDERDSRDNR